MSETRCAEGEVLHHMAFRLSLALPICGADSECMTLETRRVTCGPCRRIVGAGAGPAPADEGDDLLDDQADRYLQDVLESGS